MPYRVLRNEPRTVIGDWSADLVQGEILDLPADVADALLAGENPLVEEASDG
jgi:hypothetical protein